MNTYYTKIILIITVFTLFQMNNSSAQNKEWLVFNTSNSQLQSDYITSIAIDNNNVKWIGTDAGVVRIEGSNWTIFDSTSGDLPNDNVYSIAVDLNNNIWVGTDYGLAKYNGRKWTYFNTSNSLLPYDTLVFITVDNSNNIWIGTDDFGLIKYNGSSWISYTVNNSGLPDNSVWSVSFNLGKILVGTDYGLAIFDGANSWIAVNSDNSNLPNDEIWSIGIDKNGPRWLGTDSGLVKLSGIQMSFYFKSNSQLPDNSVHYIKVDNSDNKWLCTNKGLAKYNDVSWTVFDTANSGIPGNIVSYLEIDNQGNKWIATESGLAVYQAGGVVGIENPDKLPVTPDSLKLKEHENYLSLSWNYGLDSNIFFKVYRTTTAGMNYSLIADSIYELNYHDINLNQNTTYYYVVSAFSEINNKESNNSGEVSGKAIRGGLPPLPPDSLILDENADYLYLTWAYDRTDSNTFIKIYRSTTSGSNYSLIVDSLYDGEYNDSSITKGITYYYVVTAFNDIIEKESQHSKEVSGKTFTAPPPPAPPDSLKLSTNNNKIILSWKYSIDSNIFFRMYRSGQSGTNYALIKDSIRAFTFTDSSLTANKTYYYVARAYDITSQLESSISNEVSGSVNPTDVSELAQSNNTGIRTNAYFQNPLLNLKILLGKNSGTALRFNLYDEYGQCIYTENKELFINQNNLEFSISFNNYSSGVYFYTLESGINTGSGKVIILK